MCCARLSAGKSGAARRGIRVTALALCVCFAVVFLLSAAFVATHANHEHDHNGADGCCAVCARVAAARSLLCRLSAAAAVAALALGGMFAAFRDPRGDASAADALTLVGLKIRLNN
ncbi:MAG: hypothetical protein LBS90_05170 [Oscillospiraceae bacterium]|nr:hypothetical protein [Oscillospiraceae bacterium]